MTQRQKLNLIEATKEGFQARISELRTIQDTQRKSEVSARITDLLVAVRFCNYLINQLIQKEYLGPESQEMLEYIGLSELCN